MIKVEQFSRNIFLRLLLAPFPSIQHRLPINDGNGYVYQIMKIVFGRVIVVHSFILNINQDSKEFKNMSKIFNDGVLKNIQIIGPEGNS